ncbi:hypothetical protein V8C43DRAFT_281328 [Trichoderma afarasin]
MTARYYKVRGGTRIRIDAPGPKPLAVPGQCPSKTLNHVRRAAGLGRSMYCDLYTVTSMPPCSGTGTALHVCRSLA